MTDGSQLYIFLVCTVCGIASGPVYDFFYFIAAPFRKLSVRIAAEICFFIVFSGLYLFLSVMFSLPSLRIYMLAGCLLGLLLYLKSIHKILAFFLGKVYNRYKVIRKDKVSCRKRQKSAIPKFGRKKQRGLR